jgi:uncharacterized protein (DUF2237 family)
MRQRFSVDENVIGGNLHKSCSSAISEKYVGTARP